MNKLDIKCGWSNGMYIDVSDKPCEECDVYRKNRPHIPDELKSDYETVINGVNNDAIRCNTTEPFCPYTPACCDVAYTDKCLYCDASMIYFLEENHQPVEFTGNFEYED